jgi:riboflavin kinase
LKALEDQLIITRSIRSDGQYIAITKKGEEVLHREFSDYCRIFSDGGGHYVLSGIVTTGLGEGRYYMGLNHYQNQFFEKLGYYPYPGTLNLRLHPSCLEIRKKLETKKWQVIPGFTSENRTFGNARCLPCYIEDIPCAIVVPGRTHYPDDIIEIISAVELRKELSLNDKDKVTVEVSYD